MRLPIVTMRLPSAILESPWSRCERLGGRGATDSRRVNSDQHGPANQSLAWLALLSLTAPTTENCESRDAQDCPGNRI